MNIATYKVSTRLAVAFGMILVLMIGLVIVAWNGLRIIEDNLEKIVDENIYRMTLVQDMSESVHIVSRVTRTMILLQENASIEAEYKKIEAARSKYNASVELLEKTHASEAGKAIRAKMRENRLAARPLTDQVIDLARRNLDAEATEMLMQQAGPATQKWQDALDENIELQKKQNLLDEEAAKATYRNALTTLFVIAGLGIALGIAGAIIITRSLTRQLGGEPSEVGEIASRIANGDLTMNVATRSGDTSSVLHAMKQMQESLMRIVAEVRQGTDTIATASAQIASGNQDLSSRTEQQASSLEETASSMEELTSTVKQNADNARQANQLSTAASEVATKGGQVVSQVVDTMSAINQASAKIADIISVIDGIAFQTNILALNAAVEAARAGEQGRGFAVVATEVRNLAQRSAAAAKEIKELINDSVEKVTSGTRLVDEAGSTMNEVVGSVRRVTDVMAEIQAASQEQSAGIEQVNQAIGQMDQVTQQNAALVEQAASAAESLQEQAAKLSQVVAVFKIDGTQTVARATMMPQNPMSVVARSKGQSAPRSAALQVGAGTSNAVAAKRKMPAPAATGGGDWEEF